MSGFEPNEIDELCRELRAEAEKERQAINCLHNSQMSEAPLYEKRAAMFERAADLLAIFKSRSKR